MTDAFIRLTSRIHILQMRDNVKGRVVKEAKEATL